MKSEHLNPEASPDPLEEVVKILSDLPCEKALKDIERNRITQDVRAVIETIALYKIPLLKTMALISRREVVAMKLLKMHYDLSSLEQHTDIDWANVKVEFNGSQKD